MMTVTSVAFPVKNTGALVLVTVYNFSALHLIS